MASAVIFHLIAVLHFYFGFWYDRTYITKPDTEWRGYKFGGRLVYLTLWNMIIQSIYYTIALLNDIIGSNETEPKKRPVIRRIRDYIFATYAFPFTMFVGLMFHVLMLIDRNLVMPAEVDKFFPWWLNHIVHTNIMIFIVFEYYFLPRHYPCRKAAMTGIVAIMALYIGWIFCIKANTDRWMYPILTILNWPQRFGFFTLTIGIVFVLYFLGEFLNSIKWGTAIDTYQNSQKSKKKKSKAN